MKQNFNHKFSTIGFGALLLFFMNVLVPFISFGQRIIKDSLGEVSIFYSGKYPNEAVNSWANNNWAPNGIAHDRKNWYICSVSKGYDGIIPCKVNNKDFIIYRVPVSVDLNQNFNNASPPVVKWQLSNYNTPPDASFKNYGHAGDLDCFSYSNVDYLAVPLTWGGVPIIAFFRAADLKFLNYAKVNNLAGRSIGYCAINPVTKKLYTSHDDAGKIYEYSVNWNIALSRSAAISGNQTGLKLEDSVVLKSRSGSTLFIRNFQGMEFTPSAHLVYTSSGLNGSPYSTDGIHLFDATGNSGWREIENSENSIMHPNAQNSCFKFAFNNSEYLDQEPEGLTIWDLGEEAGPNMKGTQLHVLVDDHNCFFEEHTKVFLHHFKSFKSPKDINVYTTNANGEPATNPQITRFLDRGGIYANCGAISTVYPSVFHPGVNTVKFTVRVDASTVVQSEAKVIVIVKNDQGLTNNGSDYLIYPNPTHSYFQVRTSTPETINLKLINSQGAVVKTSSHFNTETGRIDISGLQNGIYFIELNNTNTREKILRKLVKLN